MRGIGRMCLESCVRADTTLLKQPVTDGTGIQNMMSVLPVAPKPELVIFPSANPDDVARPERMIVVRLVTDYKCSQSEALNVMSPSEQATTERIKSEFIEKLSGRDEAVSIDYLVQETSVEDRREAKQVLRTMIDKGMLSTTPGFKYKLASDVAATA